MRAKKKFLLLPMSAQAAASAAATLSVLPSILQTVRKNKQLPPAAAADAAAAKNVRLRSVVVVGVARSHCLDTPSYRR